MSSTINCPHCRRAISLDETLAGPVIDRARREFEQQFAERAAALEARAAAQLAQVQGQINAEVNERVSAQRTAIAREEAARARQQLDAELARRDERLRELEHARAADSARLDAAAKAEAEARAAKRQYEDKLRDSEAEVQRRVDMLVLHARETARIAADESSRLRLAEKDKVIDDMRRQLAEVQRKADRTSSQLQGEIFELEIESILRSRFPHDLIEPVPKGVHGGDTLHRVRPGSASAHGAAGRAASGAPSGSPDGSCGPGAAALIVQPCGVILWELKRTQNWSAGWLAKLRDDQRAAGADVAVIVSSALPKGVATFDCVDGVWVTSPTCAIPVALALRQGLIDVAAARRTNENQQAKTDLVYRYLTGPRFGQRIRAIVEKFRDMSEDLDREQTTMKRLWAKRRTQIDAVIEATAGMYGDLQGIATGALPEIEGLEGLPGGANLDGSP